MLTVTDTGTGIDDETRQRLFEPFFTTKEMGKGTGLGLSTVYGIIKQSSGSIWVYSEPGRGTSFKIYFPRHEATDAELRATKRPRSVPRGKETILLVEDEPAVRTLAAEILGNSGYHVLEAPDGAGALLGGAFAATLAGWATHSASRPWLCTTTSRTRTPSWTAWSRG